MPNADEIFRQAAELWRAFGHPLEEHLALVASATARATGADASERSRDNSPPSLRLASESVAALCAHHTPLSA